MANFLAGNPKGIDLLQQVASTTAGVGEQAMRLVQEAAWWRVRWWCPEGRRPRSQPDCTAHNGSSLTHPGHRPHQRQSGTHLAATWCLSQGTKAEIIRCPKLLIAREGCEVRQPVRGVDDLEFATLSGCTCSAPTGSTAPLGSAIPIEHEQAHYRQSDPRQQPPGVARLLLEPRRLTTFVSSQYEVSLRLLPTW